MAATIPDTWTGTPTVTPEKITSITEAYESALSCEDVATDEEDNAYYEGARRALAAVLDLLHDDSVSGTVSVSDALDL